MWRGQNWKSSLPTTSKTDQTSTVLADSSSSDSEAKKLSSSSLVELLSTEDNETESLESNFSDSDEDSADTDQEQTPLTETESCTESDAYEVITSGSKIEADVEIEDEETENEPEIHVEDDEPDNKPEIKVESVSEAETKRVSSACTEAIMHLLNQAFASGSALVLDPSMLDADLIYEQTVALAKTAARGPRFLHRPRRPKRVAVKMTVNAEEGGDLTVEETKKPFSDSNREGKQKKDQKYVKNRDLGVPRNIDFDQEFSVQVSHGSLRVDELAKLLA